MQRTRNRNAGRRCSPADRSNVRAPPPRPSMKRHEGGHYRGLPFRPSPLCAAASVMVIPGGVVGSLYPFSFGVTGMSDTLTLAAETRDQVGREPPVRCVVKAASRRDLWPQPGRRVDPSRREGPRQGAVTVISSPRSSWWTASARWQGRRVPSGHRPPAARRLLRIGEHGCHGPPCPSCSRRETRAA